MSSHNLVLDSNELFNAVDSPSYKNPALEPFHCKTIEDIVDKIFKNIPAEAVERYTNGHDNPNSPLPLYIAEQRKLLGFYIALALIGHKNHKRYDGRPFAVHPLKAATFESNYGISCFALMPVLTHDLEEEWTNELNLSLDDSEYHSKSTALFLAPGIMAYKYVTSKLENGKPRFKNPEKFFPHINSAQIIFNCMTRRLDETYFSNLYESFYNTQTRKNLEMMLHGKHRDYPKYLEQFFGINDPGLIQDFIEKIIWYRHTKDEKEKNRRRTIMGEIADAYANRDVYHLPLPKVIKTLAKDIIIINETHLYLKGKRTEESRKSTDRISDEVNELKRALFAYRGVIDKIVNGNGEYYNKKKACKDEDKIVGLIEDPRLDKHFIQEFNEQLGAYFESPFANKRTSPEEDKSQFANMLNKCIGVMLDCEAMIVSENDVRGQYKYLRVFQKNGERFMSNDNHYIRRMGLKYLKGLQMASMGKRDAKTIQLKLI